MAGCEKSPDGAVRSITEPSNGSRGAAVPVDVRPRGEVKRELAYDNHRSADEFVGEGLPPSNARHRERSSHYVSHRSDAEYSITSGWKGAGTTPSKEDGVVNADIDWEIIPKYALVKPSVDKL